MSDPNNPHGLATGEFRVAIDDGYCEWAYTIKLGGGKCICDVIDAVADQLDGEVLGELMTREWKKVEPVVEAPRGRQYGGTIQSS